MGLDMYLECSTRGCRKKQREIEKQLEALDREFDKAYPDYDWKLNQSLPPEFKIRFDKLWSEQNQVRPRQVAYWCKVNWLHAHIVNTYASGVDECQEIPLTKEDVQDICDKIEEAFNCILESHLVEMEKVDGSDDRHPSYRIKDGGRVFKMVKDNGSYAFNDELDGVFFIDKEHAEQLAEILPTQSGFFFGDTEYDKWYAYDIHEALDKLHCVLSGWDDDMVYWYQASW